VKFRASGNLKLILKYITTEVADIPTPVYKIYVQTSLGFFPSVKDFLLHNITILHFDNTRLLSQHEFHIHGSNGS
jgi:hypothetical protein